MSQSGRYSLSSGGTPIVTIDGDIGSVTGSTVAFYALTYAGSTTKFVGTGSVMTFESTDSDSNTIIGANAGNFTLSGSHNNAFGSFSALSLTTGSRCFLGGTGSGSTLTTATDCVGIGDYALGVGALSPSKSIALGTSALEDSQGSYNIAIGHEAGLNYSSTESHNILLNNNGTASESHTLRIGAGTGSGNGELSNAYISGINGVNVGSVASVVSINNDHLGSTTLTAGSNITITPGANTITIGVTSPGVTSITGDTGSTLTGAITINANTNSGSSVFFSGTGSTLSLKVTDANDNTFVGSNAGNGGLTGTENCGLGDGVFHSLTSGANNTAIGHQALYNILSSDHNDAFGSAALFTLTTGTRNAGFGEGSINGITTGNDNIGIGYTAGSSYTSSESSNICIGSQNTGTLGESNVLRIGNGTGTSAGNLNKAFISGINGITVASSDQVVLINSSNQLSTVTPGTTGQVLTCNGSSSPTWQNAATSFTWSVITADQNATVNNGYICNKAGLLTITLPATSTVGSLIEVTGMNTATGWKIGQNAGQQIFFGTSSTTSGTGGSLASSAIYDAVRLVCNVADTSWIVISSIGNITVV